MKKLFLFLFLILSVQMVSAICGGEKETIYHFDKCSSLKLNVSGTLNINKSEYNFSNCSEIKDNEWECNCFDGFDLIMETKPNTLNNYSIEIVYVYNEEQKETKSGGGTGSNWICGNWTNCINKNKTKFCYIKGNVGINYTKTKECFINKTTIIKIDEPEKHIETNKTTLSEDINKTNEETQEPEGKFNYKFLIIIIAIILIACCLIVIYLKYWR